MLTISFCLIVANEEDYISECLHSIHDLADEIIVVDTGSTDKTIEKVKAFKKVKVFHHVWKDDFSDARNISFRHANSDLIAWIDADDILPKTSANAMEFLKFKNLEDLADVYYCPYLYGFNVEGRLDMSYDIPRIIKKKKFNNWDYKIHELLNLDKVSNSQFLDAPILHEKKYHEYSLAIERNIRILKKIIHEEKDLNPVYLFLYGRELYFQKKPQEAEEYFERFIENPTGPTFYQYYALIKLALFAEKEKNKKLLTIYLKRIAKLNIVLNFERIYLEACLACLSSKKKGYKALESLVNLDDSQKEVFLSKGEVLYYSKIQPLRKLILLAKELKMPDKAEDLSNQLQKIILT